MTGIIKAASAHLPRDAARIPAAQDGLDLSCPCRSNHLQCS